jgi:proline dehydrogenase
MSTTRPPRPDFTDTATAFALQSNLDLWMARLMFASLRVPLLSSLGPKILAQSLAWGLPLRPLVKATLFRHFCGGESVDESLRRAEWLWSHRVGSILDYAVEGTHSEEGFDQCAAEVTRVIRATASRPEIPFAVFKPTGIARFDLLEQRTRENLPSTAREPEWDRVVARTRQLFQAAAATQTRLMVDAEETWIQTAFDELLLDLLPEFNRERPIIHLTVQLYRRDGVARLRQWLDRARRDNLWLGLKLVRGAYLEKENLRAAGLAQTSPICPDKAATDAMFDEALRLCLDSLAEGHRLSLCVGTHNESSARLLTELMTSHGLDPSDSRVWTAQLLGMSDHISFNLANLGYNVAKYVPYGPVAATMPYLMRRAAENSSVAGQTGRELSLVTAEIRRRSRLP